MQRDAAFCPDYIGSPDTLFRNRDQERNEQQFNLLLRNLEKLDPTQKGLDLWARSTLICEKADSKRKEGESSATDELKKAPPPDSSLRDGDIVFQSSSGPEATAIQRATKSPLTHCGVLFKEGNDWYVYEAVQPVKKTLLKDFAKNGDGDKYVVRRLKDADNVLTDKVLDKMHKYLKQNVGKDYDLKFEWSDDRMYCSELVWKAYRDATGLKVGKLKKMGDYDLSDPDVKKALEDRYGKNLPLSEPTIAPGAIFDSKLLKTVR